MKRHLLIGLVLISQIATAQKAINIEMVTRKMSRGDQPGFQVIIPEAKAKDIASAYERILEENTKAKAKESSGELVSYGVMNKSFSDRPFIVYSKFDETKEGVTMLVFVTQDSMTFIGRKSDEGKINCIKNSLNNFATTEYRKVVNKRLEGEKKKLSSLNDDIEDNVSDQNHNIKSISSKNREIEEDKIKLEENKSAQVAKNEQIVRQQKMVDDIGVKDSPEYELATKNLKNFQSDQRSLEKSAEKLNRNIENNKDDIVELQNKNELLKREQEVLKSKISDQEKYVATVEDELTGIK